MQRQGPAYTVEGYLDGVRTFADSVNRAEGGRWWAAVVLVGLLLAVAGYVVYDAVLFVVGTWRPFVGEYPDTKTEGVYACRACGAELFRSDAKFESHCGWPSFFTPLAGDAVIERVDTSLGMRRVEVVCATCHSHLGHVFEGEGYQTPTDLRYCINSVSLKLEPDAS